MSLLRPATAATAAIVPSTLVVAASDSKDTTRADYICPVDDALDYITTTVIPALPAAGGAITLLEGTYNVSTNTKPLKIDTKTNIMMRGQGEGTKFCLANGIQSNIIEVLASSGILIEDLYIDGTTSAADGGSNDNQCGILFNNVDVSKIRNVTASYNERVGIRLYNGSERNEIINCECRYNEQSGIIIETAWNTVRGNKCRNNSGHGISLLLATTHNTIAENTCNNNGYQGIDLLNSGTKNNNISNNVCTKNMGRGISNDYSERNLFIGNVCLENYDDGIRLEASSHNIITGNICIDNDYGNTNSFDGIFVHEQSDYNFIIGNKCYVTNAAQKQRYGIRITSRTGNRVIDNDLRQGGRTGDFSDAGTDTEYYDSEIEMFMDLLAATANHIVAAEDLTAITPITCAPVTQPDVPRNVTITVTDADTSISAFQITVTGKDANGKTITEEFLFAGGLTQTGSEAYATITSVVVDSITGAGANDVLDVGIGSKLGLPGQIIVTGDVFKIKKNNADYTTASYTVNTTYHTVDVSTGGAIGGGDDFTIYYRRSRNRVT